MKAPVSSNIETTPLNDLLPGQEEHEQRGESPEAAPQGAQPEPSQHEAGRQRALRPPNGRDGGHRWALLQDGQLHDGAAQPGRHFNRLFWNLGDFVEVEEVP